MSSTPPIIDGPIEVFMGRCPWCGYTSSKLQKRKEVERRTVDHMETCKKAPGRVTTES